MSMQSPDTGADSPHGLHSELSNCGLSTCVQLSPTAGIQLTVSNCSSVVCRTVQLWSVCRTVQQRSVQFTPTVDTAVCLARYLLRASLHPVLRPSRSGVLFQTGLGSITTLYILPGVFRVVLYCDIHPCSAGTISARLGSYCAALSGFETRMWPGCIESAKVWLPRHIIVSS